MKLLNQEVVSREEFEQFEDEVIDPIDERVVALENFALPTITAILKLRRACIGLLIWAAISVPLLIIALLK